MVSTIALVERTKEVYSVKVSCILTRHPKRGSIPRDFVN